MLQAASQCDAVLDHSITIFRKHTRIFDVDLYARLESQHIGIPAVATGPEGQHLRMGTSDDSRPTCHTLATPVDNPATAHNSHSTLADRNACFELKLPASHKVPLV